MSTASTYANPAALVSTEWVGEHLDDPHTRLLEVDVDTTAYERGHICCAIGINWTTQLGDPIRRDIPTRAAFEELMRQCRRGQRHHARLLRRQQQLVRRVRLLAGRDVRPRQRRADERRPQEVGAGGPTADDGPAGVPAGVYKAKRARPRACGPT